MSYQLKDVARSLL